MDMAYYKKYEPLFGAWRITSQLGEGSFGQVFGIEREDFGETYKAALKVIMVPKNESELKSIMQSGIDDASVTEYVEGLVKDIVSEFVLMSKLKGNSNIVSYEDHRVIPHEGKVGWDILIRMELLTPLMEYAQTTALRRKDVIKLGIDMCNALELCQRYNIIHRDIKPENIFISNSGSFKLGDFGIARTIEKAGSSLSIKGTYTYMAPEIYKGESYGSSVDIYSLGIVMHRLLNENRTPFLPAYPEKIKHSDIEVALKKRINGEDIPAPTGADGRLSEIVLKACAFNPAARYSSPMQMREELAAILYETDDVKAIYPQGDEITVKENEYAIPLERMKADTDVQAGGTESLFAAVSPGKPFVQTPAQEPSVVPLFESSKPFESGKSETHTSKFCKNCGSVIALDVKFCKQCGTVIPPSTEPQAPPLIPPMPPVPPLPEIPKIITPNPPQPQAKPTPMAPPPPPKINPPPKQPSIPPITPASKITKPAQQQPFLQFRDTIKFCKYCGTALQIDTKFCKGCGRGI